MSTEATYPHPLGMPSFWTTERGPLDSHRTTPNLPEASDIVIVGAGYSAASLVTHLIEECKGALPSILVLEARQLCSGATGRNGGHLKPDGYNSTSRYTELYGSEAATEAALFELANVKAVSEYIEDERVDCDFVLTRAIDVFFSDDLSQRIRIGHNKLKKAGVASAQNTFALPDKYAEELTGVKGAKSAYSYTSGMLWPYKLVHHMFDKAISKGVNLQTETQVQSILEVDGSEGFWIVRTDRGDVRTKKVILTTNAYTSALLPEYKDKIIPYRALCCKIECPKTAPLLTNSYSLRFNDWDFDYLIPRPDGSIIVGGGRAAYLPYLDDWYGNVDDSTLIDRAKGYFDGYMQRHFRGWEHSGAQVSHIWSGILGYSSDRLPRVGPVPNRPGIFIMAGFSGHGMPQIFLSAKGIAKMVATDTPFSRSGVPRLYEESEKRLKDKNNQVLGLWNMAKVQPRL